LSKGKAALRMLVKVNTDVNFANILQASFSYKSVLRSFSLLKVWLCNFCVEKGNLRKSCSKNVGEIDTRTAKAIWTVQAECDVRRNGVAQLFVNKHLKII